MYIWILLVSFSYENCLFRNKRERILKKLIKLFILIILLNNGFGLDLYPVERAVLDELILTNELIQPISGIEITESTSNLLEGYYFNGILINKWFCSLTI